MNGNRWQLQGPGGYTPQLTAGPSPETFFFNLRGLPAKLGNDYLYADSIRARVFGPIHLTSTIPSTSPVSRRGSTMAPNRQQLANVVRQIRVYSPLLGELYPRRATYGTFLINHDNWFDRRFRRNIPESARQMLSQGQGAETLVQAFVDLEIPFERDYGVSPDDFTPLMSLLEGGQLEIDLAPTNCLTGTNYGAALGSNPWVLDGTSNAWSCRASIHYHHDSQLFIHVPTQKRMYEQTLSAPSMELQNVGAPQGLDGVISGSRIAVMSMLGVGPTVTVVESDVQVDPNKFYTNAAAGSGVNFAEQGLSRLDIPWRDQRSVIDVQSWIQDFMTDIKRVPLQQQWGANEALTIEAENGLILSDLSGFPYDEDIVAQFNSLPSAPAVGDPLLNPHLGFWPIIWPSAEGSKVADMQMVDGTLQHSMDFATPPSSRAYRFRTDEVTMFTPDKMMDIMDALQVPHVNRGGQNVYIPKYDGSRMGSQRVAAFLPQKIVPKSAVGG
jgi:hypothetical protein